MWYVECVGGGFVGIGFDLNGYWTRLPCKGKERLNEKCMGHILMCLCFGPMDGMNEMPWAYESCVK